MSAARRRRDGLNPFQHCLRLLDVVVHGRNQQDAGIERHEIRLLGFVHPRKRDAVFRLFESVRRRRIFQQIGERSHDRLDFILR